jgi:hypothetical protein
LHIEFDDFCDAKIAERFGSLFDRVGGGLVPGFFCVGREAFASGPEILRRLVQLRQNASILEDGCAGFSSGSANRCDQPSWANFITTTPELKFSVHTGEDHSLLKIGCRAVIERELFKGAPGVVEGAACSRQNCSHAQKSLSLPTCYPEGKIWEA